MFMRIKFKRDFIFYSSLCTVLFFAIFSNVYAQIPFKPFPQHIVYTTGTIKPDLVSQAELDKETTLFYDLWKAHYLKKACSPNQYYVWFESNGGGANKLSIAISEGHGYGMLITALMAGYDENAQTYFDGLFNFYCTHKSRIDTNLMAWNQVAGCVNAPNGGDDAATDGDLDIAFSLLLAYKQWGNETYLLHARSIINSCLESEVNPHNSTLLLGDFCKDSTSKYFFDTRPSDFMMDHFKAFNKFSDNNRWTSVLDTCYSLITTMQTNFSPETGLLPDFILETNKKPHPPKGYFLEGKNDGNFSFNACRTPWRIATDYLLNGDKRAFEAVEKMNNWIKKQAGNKPELIRSGYKLNGEPLKGEDAGEVAFMCSFGVSAMVNNSHQPWLNSLWTATINKKLSEEDYFGNSLKMISLLMMSGNWWSPE
jgi:endo-1,4-beta-D-glucanase Y